MRASGKVLARAREAARQLVAPGVTTDELDAVIHKVIIDAGATPSFLNYESAASTPFPKASCISVNEVVVHGIPGPRVLQEGDIVGIDIGVYMNGYHTDSAWTYPVGTVDEATAKLLRVSQESLFKGIEKAKPGNRIGDVSAAIQKYLDSHGYGIVRDLVGHGIGQSLHEAPSVPNFGKAGTGPKIKEGMTFCIEPMVNAGTWRVKTLEDEWTMVTADGKYSAHFEHTVAITKNGAEILTDE